MEGFVEVAAPATHVCLMVELALFCRIHRRRESARVCLGPSRTITSNCTSKVQESLVTSGSVKLPSVTLLHKAAYLCMSASNNLLLLQFLNWKLLAVPEIFRAEGSRVVPMLLGFACLTLAGTYMFQCSVCVLVALLNTTILYVSIGSVNPWQLVMSKHSSYSSTINAC